MSHRTSIRRAAAIVGTTGVIALSMAAPASARQDPGAGNQQEWSCRSLCYEGGTTDNGSISTVLRNVDDNAIEIAQLGAGVLAGVALTGAGLAVATRRRHSHAHAAHPA